MSLTPKDTWNHKFKDLSERAKDITSQYGENGIIEAVFEICLPQNKWCVDVGAADGMATSNTYPLVKSGWNSLLIEPWLETFRDDKLYGGFRKMQENLKDFPNAILLNEAVKREGLDEVLTRYSQIPKDFDFLSIDIDSYDVELLQNMEQYRPHLICIECDESFDDLNYISYRLHRPQGYNAASVGFLRIFAERKGYEFVCATKCNAFFIDKEFSKPLEKNV